MSKHPTSSRVHREEHAPDDAFVAAIKRSYTWSRENSRTVTIALAAVVILAVAAIWITAQQRNLENRANERFGQVQQSLASGNAELAIRDLQEYLDRFGGTDAADQARLLLAGLLMQQERADEATAALGDLPNDLEAPFGIPAARLKAAAFEEAGQIDQAVDTYLRIADRARFPFQQREALADAARVRMQNGDADGAARLYERVVDSFTEEETGRAYYEMWLAEARSQAETGSGTAPTTSVEEPGAGEGETDEG